MTDMNTNEENINVEESVIDVVQDNTDDPVKKKKKRKVEYDEDGKPIKKLRMTNKLRYPDVKDVQPRTAYQYYIMEKSKENRDMICSNADHPKLKTKDLSDQWRMVDDRTKWTDMANDDKERFYTVLRAHGHSVKEKKKNPTRPCSAFLLYARSMQKEYRKEHELNYPEALKALGERWRNTEFASERVPFEEEAVQLKEQWKNEHDAVTSEIVAGNESV
jgi:hypothetical protein